MMMTRITFSCSTLLQPSGVEVNYNPLGGVYWSDIKMSTRFWEIPARPLNTMSLPRPDLSRIPAWARKISLG